MKKIKQLITVLLCYRHKYCDIASFVCTIFARIDLYSNDLSSAVTLPTDYSTGTAAIWQQSFRFSLGTLSLRPNES